MQLSQLNVERLGHLGWHPGPESPSTDAVDRSTGSGIGKASLCPHYLLPQAATLCGSLRSRGRHNQFGQDPANSLRVPSRRRGMRAEACALIREKRPPRRANGIRVYRTRDLAGRIDADGRVARGKLRSGNLCENTTLRVNTVCRDAADGIGHVGKFSCGFDGDAIRQRAGAKW